MQTPEITDAVSVKKASETDAIYLSALKAIETLSTLVPALDKLKIHTQDKGEDDLLNEITDVLGLVKDLVAVETDALSEIRKKDLLIHETVLAEEDKLMASITIGNEYGSWLASYGTKVDPLQSRVINMYAKIAELSKGTKDE